MLNAGLPNILATGPVVIAPTVDGAFYTAPSDYNIDGQTTWYGATILNFDASRSNPIYGASVSVQPPSIALIPQIKF